MQVDEPSIAIREGTGDRCSCKWGERSKGLCVHGICGATVGVLGN